MGKKIINTKNAPAPIGPYSQAVLANGTLYISGMVALDSEGNLHNGSIEEEANQVMKNIQYILHEAGLDFGNIVKSSIFLKDMNNFQKVNEIYGGFFKENPPARETIEVSRLPKDVSVEISCIAVV